MGTENHNAKATQATAVRRPAATRWGAWRARGWVCAKLRRPTVAALLLSAAACTPPPPEPPPSLEGQPINVFSTVFFNQLCPQAHVVFEVPDDKLLIIEDASADAHDAATASTPGNPGLVDDTAIHLSLRTNPSGTDPMGSADHMIVAERGLPAAGGRTVRGYAAPGTRVLYLIGGCTVPVNTNVQFSGRLVDYP